jgi:hypothetical protein
MEDLSLPRRPFSSKRKVKSISFRMSRNRMWQLAHTRTGWRHGTNRLERESTKRTKEGKRERGKREGNLGVAEPGDGDPVIGAAGAEGIT